MAIEKEEETKNCYTEVERREEPIKVRVNGGDFKKRGRGIDLQHQGQGQVSGYEQTWQPGRSQPHPLF